MIVAEAAAEAAASYVSRSVYGQEEGPDAGDLRHGRALVLAIAPYILEAERARLRTLIDPAGLELLALYLDSIDDAHEVPGDERLVQEDLRTWAMVLRGGEPAPETVTQAAGP